MTEVSSSAEHHALLDLRHGRQEHTAIVLDPDAQVFE